MRSLNLFILFFVLLLSCSNVMSKKEVTKETFTPQSMEQHENVVTIFLDIDFTGVLNVYDKPDGKIISTIQNNIEEENFVMFNLLQKNDSMFYVVAYHSLEEDTITKGWIIKNSHLGIYSRMYNPEVRPMILYKTPNDTFQIVAKETEYNPNMYEVVDFEEKWLKIRAKINDKIYEGWLPPEMQCSNVYSTCS